MFVSNKNKPQSPAQFLLCGFTVVSWRWFKQGQLLLHLLQRSSRSRRLTWDRCCPWTGLSHSHTDQIHFTAQHSQLLISVFLEHSALKRQQKPSTEYGICHHLILPLISLFARQEKSVLNFFSFFPSPTPHFFPHSTLQVKVSEPQNSIDMNTENEHLKSIKMCLNQPTEWNLSFSAASLASCKVFNQNLKTDENK